jgi:hypothetical protein
VVIDGIPDLYGWYADSPCDPCKQTGQAGPENNPILAPYGIDGFSINDPTSYKGSWHIQVHVVPIYNYYPGHYINQKFPHAIGTSTYTTAGTNPLGFEAMLVGELTYNAQLVPDYTNHPGPYELRYDVNIPNQNYGGEGSAVFELDRLALVSGNVVGYSWVDDWRSTSWTTVQFVAANGQTFNYYTADGRFSGYVFGDVQQPVTPYPLLSVKKYNPYTVNVIYWSAGGQGFKVVKNPGLSVSDGTLTSFNTYLEPSGIPIPEFPVAAIVLASALAASLFILRKRRK